MLVYGCGTRNLDEHNIVFLDDSRARKCGAVTEGIELF